jgi:hypothetical protein
MTEEELLLKVDFKSKSPLDRDEDPDYMIFKFWGAQAIKS